MFRPDCARTHTGMEDRGDRIGREGQGEEVLVKLPGVPADALAVPAPVQPQRDRGRGVQPLQGTLQANDAGRILCRAREGRHEAQGREEGPEDGPRGEHSLGRDDSPDGATDVEGVPRRAAQSKGTRAATRASPHSSGPSSG